MKIAELRKEISENIIRPYYFVCGKEAHLISLAVAAIEKTDGIMFPELNIERIKNECSAEDIIRMLNTLPFACERRLVLCDMDCLDDSSKKKLASYLPSCTNSAILVIIKNGKAEKNKVLEKELIKSGNFVDCSEPRESEVVDYITAYAAKKLVKISRNTASFMVEYVGSDMGVLIHELEKLLCIAEKEITTEDIRKYCVSADSYNIFLLHEFMLGRDLKSARELINDILRNDDKPLGIISLVASNFEIMMMLRSCLDAGYPPERAVRTVVDSSGVNEYRARKTLGQCKKLSLEEIRKALVLLSDMDYRAKQGRFTFISDLFPDLCKVYSV